MKVRTLPRGSTASVPHTHSLRALEMAARSCRGCPLYKHATQTVFGEGPSRARLLLVGEQPGNEEDLQGRPFVGPAGRLLDDALQAAGIAREDTYLTNVVKHFKWTPRGKRRLHQRPGAGEIEACRPWLDAELSALAPEVLVCLGATAAQALIRPGFKVTTERGTAIASELAPHVIATVHPSSILRSRSTAEREQAFAAFVADLRVAAALLRSAPAARAAQHRTRPRLVSDESDERSAPVRSHRSSRHT